MPAAISDSSTLIHLAAVGELALLRHFYEAIVIPPAVWHEVVVEGKGRAGAAEVQKAAEDGWIETVSPEDEALLQLLKRQLNAGEAEAITLAVEKQAAIVFLDESEARHVAEALGLNKTGVIGVLIRAKLEGRVDSLAEKLDQLRNEGGFWISDKLYHQALEVVGE